MNIKQSLPFLLLNFHYIAIQVCPLENDVNSLVMVIGGETIASRENEHSTSVEIIGPNGPCR